MTTATAAQAQAPAAPPVPSFMADLVGDEGFGDPGSIMLHAEPGKGKSLAAGRIINVPGINSAIVLDVDNGTNVYLNDPAVNQARKEGRIKIIRIDKTAPDAFSKFHTYFWEIVNAGGYGFDAFIVDTMDVAQELAVDWFTATTYNDQGTALDTRKAYGIIAKWTSDILWALQNNPNFVGITVVHTKTEEEKKTKVSTLKPKFAGSVRDTAAGIPDIVVYLTKEEHEDGSTNIHANMSGVGDIVSKQRYSAFLPDHLDDFTLPKLYELIRNGAAGITAEPDAVPTLNIAPPPAAPVVDAQIPVAAAA